MRRSSLVVVLVATAAIVPGRAAWANPHLTHAARASQLVAGRQTPATSDKKHEDVCHQHHGHTSDGPAGSERSLRAYRCQIVRATVTLPGKSCAGFVAGQPDQVITASHCVPRRVAWLWIRTSGGERRKARLDHVDRDTDLALLRLRRPLAVTPLALSTELPRPGERILFVGRIDRPSKTQVASVLRLGRCPSLPEVSRAVFTSIDARPGDSGAPIVDSRRRVVGIVHGGARCHIAAPIAPLARALEARSRSPRLLHPEPPRPAHTRRR